MIEWIKDRLRTQPEMEIVPPTHTQQSIILRATSHAMLMDQKGYRKEHRKQLRQLRKQLQISQAKFRRKSVAAQ